LVRCTAMSWWSIMSKYYIYVFWIINMNQWWFNIFFTDGVSGIKNLNACVLNFCFMSVVQSVWVKGFFVVCNWWIGSGFIFEAGSWFLIFQ
jgi:hypothetical protein